MALIDPFGRHITYLRVSVTDRCDFRCLYCMSEDMTFLPKSEVLSLEELDRLCSAFVDRGVRKLRLTGGEPLVRKNIMSLIKSLSRHLESRQLDELTLTTNGSQLERYADDLAACGIRRINVSLDSLDAEHFRAITRWGDLAKVLRGIDAALDAGIKIKINTVALKDFNEGEIDHLLNWCGSKGMDLTLIETMPLGDIGGDRTDQYVPLPKIRNKLAQNWTFEETRHQTGGPSRYVKIRETGTMLGFITPMSENFCASCNRVRVTCTGQLYMCLGHEDRADLRAPLRQSDGDDLLHAAIDRAITRKPERHDFDIKPGLNTPAVARHMNVTGG